MQYLYTKNYKMKLKKQLKNVVYVMFMDWKAYVVKISVLLRLIYRVYLIPVPTGYLGYTN